MDSIAEYNRARWKALAEADALFTRPHLDLDRDSALELVDKNQRFGAIDKKTVLCLAGGGGQQAAAFALLGADVTVFDLSDEQLKRDEQVAEHYRVELKTFEGDMRDLSRLEADTFDIVYQPYSLNFVPDAASVFRQVARIVKKGGIFYLSCANPFTMEMDQNDWNGDGYVLKKPYLGGARITSNDQDWVYNKDLKAAIPNPVEYRHTLGDLINGLTESGFVIFAVSDTENFHPNSNDDPGSWGHFTSFAPPWLSFWTTYNPEH
ncbi:MAG: class I SAM-dependent methyltransferase [Acidobacteria bacterium]|nr:class I SAM-dependent methyltransferase [Acidobacteriota bacterium]